MQSAECGVKKQNNRNRFNRGERGGRIGRKTANGEAGRPESGNKPLPRDGAAGIGRNLKLASGEPQAPAGAHLAGDRAARTLDT